MMFSTSGKESGLSAASESKVANLFISPNPKYNFMTQKSEGLTGYA